MSPYHSSWLYLGGIFSQLGLARFSPKDFGILELGLKFWNKAPDGKSHHMIGGRPIIYKWRHTFGTFIPLPCHLVSISSTLNVRIFRRFGSFSLVTNIYVVKAAETTFVRKIDETLTPWVNFINRCVRWKAFLTNLTWEMSQKIDLDWLNYSVTLLLGKLQGFVLIAQSFEKFEQLSLFNATS